VDCRSSLHTGSMLCCQSSQDFLNSLLNGLYSQSIRKSRGLMATVSNSLLVKVPVFEFVASSSASFQLLIQFLEKEQRCILGLSKRQTGTRCKDHQMSSCKHQLSKQRCILGLPKRQKQIPDAKITKYPVVNTNYQIRTSQKIQFNKQFNTNSHIVLF